jgi:hypothetical protein
MRQQTTYRNSSRSDNRPRGDGLSAVTTTPQQHHVGAAGQQRHQVYNGQVLNQGHLDQMQSRNAMNGDAGSQRQNWSSSMNSLNRQVIFIIFFRKQI